MSQLKTPASPNIVVVPDMAALDLTALVEKELNLTYLESLYRKWDYHVGNDGTEIVGRGRRYEALIWKPELRYGEGISSIAVRRHFKKEKAYGHPGAYMQWRRTCGLSGYHASIFDDRACYETPTGVLFISFSCFLEGFSAIRLQFIGTEWSRDFSFVAFREIP